MKFRSTFSCLGSAFVDSLGLDLLKDFTISLNFCLGFLDFGLVGFKVFFFGWARIWYLRLPLIFSEEFLLEYSLSLFIQR